MYLMVSIARIVSVGIVVVLLILLDWLILLIRIVVVEFGLDKGLGCFSLTVFTCRVGSRCGLMWWQLCLLLIFTNWLLLLLCHLWFIFDRIRVVVDSWWLLLLIHIVQLGIVVSLWSKNSAFSRLMTRWMKTVGARYSLLWLVGCNRAAVVAAAAVVVVVGNY